MIILFKKGVSASPISDDNIYIWNATIMGPDDSAWEGGIFQLRLVFTGDYPSKPPKEVRFLTDVYHPNVYGDGSLCLDIIQDKWSPTYTVCTLLASIQVISCFFFSFTFLLNYFISSFFKSLLTDPNANSPANPEAARLLTSDPKAYAKKVRRCAQRSVE
jgi:ubiquitin-conjugating enzyme E2 A